MFLLKLLAKIEYHLSQPKINIFRTIYFNLRVLPFKTAIKFPIYIYGKVSFYWLKGEVLFENCEIKRGMITLGKSLDYFTGVRYNNSYILLAQNSKLIFEGPAIFNNDYIIRVNSGAELRFGEYAYTGSSVRFFCSKNIKIGAYTRIGFSSMLMDTNSHYVYNVNKKTVSRVNAPIIIGAYNWIGNKSSITKGAKTKDFTIVASGSMLNKDYASVDTEYNMIAGSPAKILAHGIRRVFSTDLDCKFNKFFEENEILNEMIYSDEFVDEYESIKSQYKF